MKATINGTRYDTDKCHELAKRVIRGPQSDVVCLVHLMEAGDGKLLVWKEGNSNNDEYGDSLYSFVPIKELPSGRLQHSIDDFTSIVDMDRLIEIGILKESPSCDKEIDRARLRSDEMDDLLCMDAVLKEIEDLKKKIKDVGASLVDLVREGQDKLERSAFRIYCIATHKKDYPFSYDMLEKTCQEYHPDNGTAIGLAAEKEP